MDEVKPILKQCQENLRQYKQDNDESKIILRRFDEVLLEKASKFSLDLTNERINQ